MGEQVQASRVRTLGPGEVAWLAVLPSAVLVVAAMLLLGQPLGSAFFAPGSERFWPEAERLPEPTEHARFIIALLGAPLVTAGVVASRRWPVRLRPRIAHLAIGAGQLSLVVLLAASLLAQHGIFLRLRVLSPLPGEGQGLFDVPMLVGAAAIAAALGLALSRRAVAARITALGRETRTLRIACGAVAMLLIAVWLLRAFNTEHTVRTAPASNLIPWQMSEAFAVLDGRTPLVDFHSQYAQLVPYVAAGGLRVLGSSAGAWTGTMIVLSALALLAVYAVLRRVTRRSLLALTLFAPFLAASAFLIGGIVTPLTIFSLWPMRYAGPCLLAWLTVRHLDAAAPRRRALLLGAGGLVALNNLEFGLPALGGTIVAIVAAEPPRSLRALGRVAADLAAGLLGAVALVSAFTLIWSGSLPYFGLLLEFPRIYGIGGWVLVPMPTVGFHLVLYATFAGALALAAVRAVRGEDPLLTGMLAWSAIFGLGASSYYAGRSDQLNLISLFSAWALALTLVTLVAIRSLVADARRRPTPAQLAVLFCWGLTVCAISQLSWPWTHLQRLERTTAPVYKQRDAVALVRATTRPHERVAILTPLGHRVAFDAGVVNVAPYASAEAMPTIEQFDAMIDAMARHGVTRVFLDRERIFPALYEALVAAGYELRSERGRYMLLTNAPIGL
jgi:hypothetical protein